MTCLSRCCDGGYNSYCNQSTVPAFA
eukprot:COSAG01_NODE_60278_length_295_cov_1.637755_1_plen_25_part_01